MKTRKLAVTGGAFILALLIIAAPTSAVQARALETQDQTQLLWNAEQWLDYSAVHGDGIDGEGVTIAVIDEAINLQAPELAGANVQVRGTTCLSPQTGEPAEIESDDAGLAAHGTNVVSMLSGSGQAADGAAGAQGIAPGATVWFYGVGSIDQVKDCTLQDPTRADDDIDLASDITLGEGAEVYENPTGGGDATALAARAAIRDGADIITVAVLSGLGDWDQVLLEAQANGVVVVSGTPNPDTDFGFVGGPWLTNGAAPVSAIGPDGSPLASLTTGDRGAGSSNLAFAVPGASLLGVGDDAGWGPREINGSSYSAPILAGSLALMMQKFAGASAFQALQALVRTTGAGEPHDPVWNDAYLGYGYANPKSGLLLDPRDFPDENPLFVSDIDDPRCTTSNGEPGTIDSDGQRWLCAWSVGPYPPQAEAYAAVVRDGAQVLSSSGERVDSVYGSQSNTPAGTGFTVPVWGWIALAVGVLLVIAIVVAVVLARSTARRGAAQQNSDR
ncbi:S8 family serine peptidase [Leucobacter japonicus]|uniref:S8 family serine peptidase n=1 Tax=Leucobacter japonicus TaxID=1461259 RepID=UPI0006A7779B|nr:S8 family serine peptidase [Leucobacter japonicus]